jgi:hypothetical protein
MTRHDTMDVLTGFAVLLIALCMSGFSYAGEKIAFHCEGTMDYPGTDVRGERAVSSVVVDLDKGVVTGDNIGIYGSLPITEVTETHIKLYKAVPYTDGVSGFMDRFTGALSVTYYGDKSKPPAILYAFTCKPAKPLF